MAIPQLYNYNFLPPIILCKKEWIIAAALAIGILEFMLGPKIIFYILGLDLRFRVAQYIYL